MWMAAKEASRLIGTWLPEETLLRALRSTDPVISAGMAWDALMQFSKSAPNDPEEWANALREGTELANQEAPSEDPDDAFGRVLLARQLGAAPADSEAWITRLTRPDGIRADGEQVATTIANYLTSRELGALQERFRVRNPDIAIPARTSSRPGKYLPPPERRNSLSIRTISRLPVGLMASMESTYSKLFKKHRDRLLLGQVWRDAAGRVTALREDLAWVKADDADALRSLFALSLPAQSEVNMQAASEQLIVFTNTGFLALTNRPWWRRVRYLNEDLGQVSAPERVKFVSPDYPSSQRRARNDGSVVFEVVVDDLGDVAEIRVKAMSSPDYVVSAIPAIMKWKYKPARQAGVAVPVFLTVIVDFDIH
jgi:TonB family protein